MPLNPPVDCHVHASASAACAAEWTLFGVDGVAGVDVDFEQRVPLTAAGGGWNLAAGDLLTAVEVYNTHTADTIRFTLNEADTAAGAKGYMVGPGERKSLGLQGCYTTSGPGPKVWVYGTASTPTVEVSIAVVKP